MQGVEVKDCIRLHTRVWADCLNISLEVFRIFLDVAEFLYLIAIRNRKGTQISAKIFNPPCRFSMHLPG
jgi:hypothetical protein